MSAARVAGVTVVTHLSWVVDIGGRGGGGVCDAGVDIAVFAAQELVQFLFLQCSVY